MPLTAVSSRDQLVVGERRDVVEIELARDDVLGQRAQEADLRARQADRRAQLLGVVGEDLLGRGRRPPKRSSIRPHMTRATVVDSCWPTIARISAA